jgi:hypothetical protein
VEGRLLHHVTRQLDAVSLAPVAAGVGKGDSKAIQRKRRF